MKTHPYYYDRQIERYLIQFTNIFTGFQVKVGIGDREQFASVPITYGSYDKVVASIFSMNTQNKPIRLPMMSTYMTGVEMAPEMYKGVGQEDRYSYLPSGGMLPDDVRVIHRYMPIPYRVTTELFVYSSNQVQQLQILEQILMLFDPTMVIQTSDARFDMTKLSVVELKSITLDEQIPPGADERMIIAHLNFDFVCWISPPIKDKDDFVQKIKLRVGIAGQNMSEQDIIDFFDTEGLKYHTIADATELFK